MNVIINLYICQFDYLFSTAIPSEHFWKYDFYSSAISSHLWYFYLSWKKWGAETCRGVYFLARRPCTDIFSIGSSDRAERSKISYRAPLDPDTENCTSLCKSAPSISDGMLRRKSFHPRHPHTLETYLPDFLAPSSRNERAKLRETENQHKFIAQ